MILSGEVRGSTEWTPRYVNEVVHFNNTFDRPLTQGGLFSTEQKLKNFFTGSTFYIPVWSLNSTKIRTTFDRAQTRASIFTRIKCYYPTKKVFKLNSFVIFLITMFLVWKRRKNRGKKKQKFIGLLGTYQWHASSPRGDIRRLTNLFRTNQETCYPKITAEYILVITATSGGARTTFILYYVLFI